MTTAVPLGEKGSPLALPAADSPSVPGDWFLVQLRPGGFERARRNLERQNVIPFMPKRWETRQRNGRLAQTLRPLFPGYLFVRFSSGEYRWQAINSTYGVARIVCLHAGRPTAIPEGLVQALRAACDAEGVMHQRDALYPGQPVRVIAGPFAGVLSRIEAVPDRERVLLLMEIMGREVATTVPAAHVESA